MKDQEKNLQHAMTSFALFGGMLLSPRPKNSGTLSNPQSFKPLNKK